MPKMLLLAKLERMASIRHQLGTGLPRAKTRTRTGTNARAGVEILAIELTIAAIEEQLPCSHYYLRSLSRTSRPFYFLDSRDLLEVLTNFLGRERGGGSLGDPPGP